FWLDMMGAPLVIVSGHDLVDELSDEKRFDKAVRGSLRRVRAVESSDSMLPTTGFVGGCGIGLSLLPDAMSEVPPHYAPSS
ncbi:hypothetical protein, partial [Bradyrhizobium uaiense]